MRNYYEVTIIIDGALSDTANCTGNEAKRAIEDAIAWSAQNPNHVQVYTLFHGHEDYLECECIQFAQDHRPVFDSENP